MKMIEYENYIRVNLIKLYNFIKMIMNYIFSTILLLPTLNLYFICFFNDLIKYNYKNEIII